MKRLGGLTMIKLPCIQCIKILFSGNSFKALDYDEELYPFCSEYCRDNWASDVALLSEPENLQQSTAQTHPLHNKEGYSMRRMTFLLFQLFLAIFAAYAVMNNVPNENLLVPLACLVTIFLLGKHPQAQTEFVIWWEE
jgi:endogenous inhibitor of DNA gyrase (YacG/DUF329 family)